MLILKCKQHSLIEKKWLLSKDGSIITSTYVRIPWRMLLLKNIIL